MGAEGKALHALHGDVAQIRQAHPGNVRHEGKAEPRPQQRDGAFVPVGEQHPGHGMAVQHIALGVEHRLGAFVGRADHHLPLQLVLGEAGVLCQGVVVPAHAHNGAAHQLLKKRAAFLAGR